MSTWTSSTTWGPPTATSQSTITRSTIRMGKTGTVAAAECMLPTSSMAVAVDETAAAETAAVVMLLTRLTTSV